MRGLGSGSYITEETLRVALAAVGMDDDPTDPEQWRSYFYSRPPEPSRFTVDGADILVGSAPEVDDYLGFAEVWATL